jgi:hypothetical protein
LRAAPLAVFLTAISYFFFAPPRFLHLAMAPLAYAEGNTL